MDIEALKETLKETPEAIALLDSLASKAADAERYQAKHGEAEKHRKQAEQRLREIEEAASAREAAAAKAAEEAARKAGDVDALGNAS